MSILRTLAVKRELGLIMYVPPTSTETVVREPIPHHATTTSLRVPPTLQFRELVSGNEPILYYCM